MPKSNSGRVVVEIDPLLKRQLYSRLAAEGTTLKHWFLESAAQFLSQGDVEAEIVRRSAAENGRIA